MWQISSGRERSREKTPHIKIAIACALRHIVFWQLERMFNVNHCKTITIGLLWRLGNGVAAAHYVALMLMRRHNINAYALHISLFRSV